MATCFIRRGFLAGKMVFIRCCHNTEEEALDDPGTGDSYWTYEFHAANGITWIQAAFGTVPDQPIQSDDGTWAWQYQSKVYYMYSQPEQIIVRSRYYNNGTGYDESKNEDCILTFSLED